MQIGLRIEDLNVLEYGEVLDMLTEAANDNYNYKEIASQGDFDRF